MRYMEDVINKYNCELPPVVERTLSTIRVLGLECPDLWFEIFQDLKPVFNYSAQQSLGNAVSVRRKERKKTPTA